VLDDSSLVPRPSLTPVFVACSTNAGVRRPGYEARMILQLCILINVDSILLIQWNLS